MPSNNKISVVTLLQAYRLLTNVITYQLFDVFAERSRIGGDLMLLQKRRNVRKRHRMGFVGGLPEIFEYEI